MRSGHGTTAGGVDREVTDATYDLVVIGLGSAGLTAARLAADQLGLRVAAVERDRIGGDCLWTGCVPSKTLLASARAAHTVRTADRFGVAGSEPSVDLGAVWERIHDVQDGIAVDEDSADRLRAIGIEVVFGTARLTGPHDITVDSDRGARHLRAAFVLISTGSRAAVPPIPGIDAVDVETSDSFFAAPPAAGPLAVVGGGPVGVEISQAMRRLGLPVTLVEMAPHLLPREEPELADRLTEVLRADGVDVRTSTGVDRVEARGGQVIAHAGGEPIVASTLLVATGRTPNVEHLGLGRLGVDLDEDGVVVDARNRTSLRNVYVVGDAASGRPAFTHTAAYDAGVAVRDMFFPGAGRPSSTIPWSVFTSPELARVGLTEAEARARHGDRWVRLHQRELAGNDRARAEDATQGVVRVVTAGRRIVGAHVLGPGAGDVINEFAIAIDRGLTLHDLGAVVHVYPTIATDAGRVGADGQLSLARRLRPAARLTSWRHRRRVS